MCGGLGHCVVVLVIIDGGFGLFCVVVWVILCSGLGHSV